MFDIKGICDAYVEVFESRECAESKLTACGYGGGGFLMIILTHFYTHSLFTSFFFVELYV
jgi:hypothetical protein